MVKMIIMKTMIFALQEYVSIYTTPAETMNQSSLHKI